MFLQIRSLQISHSFLLSLYFIISKYIYHSCHTGTKEKKEPKRKPHEQQCDSTAAMRKIESNGSHDLVEQTKFRNVITGTKDS